MSGAIAVAPLLPYEPKKKLEEKSSTFSAIRTFFRSNFFPDPKKFEPKQIGF